MPHAIRSRKHAQPLTLRRLGAAAGLAGSLAVALPAAAASRADAATTDTAATATHLPGVQVQAAGLDRYQIGHLSSRKFTQSLLDTPQTIQIISADLIEDQGAQTLTQALRNSAGVGTFFVGENGSTRTGDDVYMRGFDASGSIFVDGVRDLGAISRDVFDIQQVEVIKGPAGTDYGRTAPSGSINMVTKQPRLDDAVSASVSYASGNQKRSTVDWNRALGEHAAFRLNLLGQKGGVAGRDTVRQNRWGIAPSLAFGLDTSTRIYLDALHMKQHNVPDGGVPTIGLPGYSSPDPSRPQLTDAARVDPGNFYGTDADHDDVSADMVTAIVDHDVGHGVTVHNITRWGRTQQNYLLTSFMSSATYFDTPNLDNSDSWSIRRLPNFRDETHRILANQTGLVVHADSGRLHHDISAGLELSREQVDIGGLGALDGSTWPAASVYHPQAAVSGLVSGDTGTRGHGRTTTEAVYAFDTVSLGGHWKLSAGARLDHYRTHFRSTALCGGRRGPDCGALATGSVVPAIDARLGDDLFTWKLGLLYKPTTGTSLYVDYATAAEPPGGDNLTLSTRDNSADNPALHPQKTRTAEIGAKWNALDRRLLLTAALYRTVVDNEITRDPVDQLYHQTGRKRVQGIELTAVGKLTDHWDVNAGFTTMDARVLAGENVSEDGSADLAYTPKSAFTAWTTYRLPSDLTVGGGARYAGALKRGTDGAVGTPAYTRAYWVFDAMASYPLNRHVNLQLNLYNLFDQHYVAAINKSGYRYTPGTPRSAMFAVNVLF